MIICPRCGSANADNAPYCIRCGLLNRQPKKNAPTESAFEKVVMNIWGAFRRRSYFAQAALALCAFLTLSAFISGILLLSKQASERDRQARAISSTTSTPVTSASVTPTPTPPPTFAELKIETGLLLAFEREEYKREDLAQYDEVMQPLKTIPKEDKNYKEAQGLLKKLIDKSSRIGAEVIVLGEKPSNGELRSAFNDYLRYVLNDYDSSEYVDYSPAIKVTVKGEPFWVSVLKLRAKNPYGGYILKDVRMYIRNKKVVLAEGL